MQVRFDIGNPPGKDSSMGDAINWETLLAYSPIKEDLHFVTEDSDYSSPLDSNAFLPFLNDEYHKVKQARIRYYKRISQFFGSQFPDIHLASEIEKDLLIKRLAESWNFAVTHAIVAELGQFTEFSVSQATAILTAAVTNSQVGWIAGDPDVRALLTSIIDKHGAKLDPAVIRPVVQALNRVPSDS